MMPCDVSGESFSTFQGVLRPSATVSHPLPSSREAPRRVNAAGAATWVWKDAALRTPMTLGHTLTTNTKSQPHRLACELGWVVGHSDARYAPCNVDAIPIAGMFSTKWANNGGYTVHKLTPREWEALRERVIARDLWQAYVRRQPLMPYARWLQIGTPCIATFLDKGAGLCAGPITLDHVKCHPMLGRKAPDTERHLVSLCWGHHIDTHAGRQWATSHRDVERRYLEETYGLCSVCT